MAQRDAGRKVEGNGRRRQLAQVVDAQRSDVAGQARHGVQRYQRAVARAHVQQRQGRRIVLVAGIQLEDHPILVAGRVDRRYLALTVGVVEGVLDLLRGDAQRGSFVAVDVDHHLRIGDLQIAGDIREARKAGELLLDEGHPVEELLGVRILRGVLVLGLGKLTADTYRRYVLQEDLQAGNGRKLGTEFLDDFLRRAALRARL